MKVALVINEPVKSLGIDLYETPHEVWDPYVFDGIEAATAAVVLVVVVLSRRIQNVRSKHPHYYEEVLK